MSRVSVIDECRIKRFEQLLALPGHSQPSAAGVPQDLRVLTDLSDCGIVVLSYDDAGGTANEATLLCRHPRDDYTRNLRDAIAGLPVSSPS